MAIVESYDIRRGRSNYHIRRIETPVRTVYQVQAPGYRGPDIGGRFFSSKRNMEDHYRSIKRQIHERVR